MIRLFIIMFTSIVLIPKGFGQTSPIRLLDFIDQTESHFGVRFSYNHKLVSGIEISSPEIKENLEKTLRTALEGSGVGFIIDNNSVSLYPSKEKKKESAEKIAISGVVKAREGGETLPNAVIKVVDQNQFTISNRDGMFSLLDIPSDTSLIRVSYLGYTPIETTLSSLRENAEIQLRVRPEVLDEVIVADENLKVIQVAGQPGQITINSRYLNNLTSFSEKDAFRSLQLLPGINGTVESSANLRIRGSSPDQNLVLFDGFTVYHLDHFFGVFSAFNSHVIKDIQIYKGSFGAEYGGRVAGVVDMIGKNGNQEKVSGTASVNLLSTSGILEVPINDKISFVLAGRRSFTDVIQTGLFSNLFEQVNEESQIGQAFEDEDLDPDFRFFDLNAKASWKITSNDLLQLSFYRGKDDLTLQQFFEESGEDFEFEQFLRQRDEWGNQGESLRYAKNWNNRLFTELKASHSTFFRNTNTLEETFLLDSVDVFDESFEFTDENEIEEFSVNLSNDYLLNKRHRFTLGGFLNHNRISYLTRFFEEEDFSLELKGLYTGLFLNHAFRIGTDTQIKSGLRYTYYELIQENYLEPRLSVTHQLFDHLNLKAAFGRHYQFVGQVATLDNSFGQDDFWLLRGIEDSPVTSSLQYLAGGTLTMGQFEFDVEGYLKDLDGLSAYRIEPNDFDDEEGDLTEGNGKIRGIDFLLKREAIRLTSWISYTLSESTNQFNEIEDNTTFNANFDQRHELKIVNSYQLNSWNFTGSWVYGSGRPYTPRFVNFDDEADFPVGEINSLRLPDYHRLDLNVSYIKTMPKFNLRFSVNFLNIYNRTNIRNIFILEQFDEESDELIDREEEIEMLGFTPSIGVEINF